MMDTEPNTVPTSQSGESKSGMGALTRVDGTAVLSTEPPAARAVDAIHEFLDQGPGARKPFDAQPTTIAGIDEYVGQIPAWLLGMMITAVVLAMIMWYPTVY